MNKDIKNKWVEALRSGDYKQTIGQLKDNNSYCCLGVLCELYAQEHEDAKFKNGSNRFNYIKEDIELIAYGVPPEPVILWSGMPNDNPTILGNISLAEHNDAGATFKEIADMIEENL